MSGSESNQQQQQQQIPLNVMIAEQHESNPPIISNNRRFNLSERIAEHKIPIIIAAIGIIVIFALAVAYFILNGMVEPDRIKADYVVGSPVCRSESCKSTAELISKSINRTVHPCDNFYDFICGNGKIDKSSSYSPFESLTSLVDKISREDAGYMKKFKRFHQSCVDYKGKDEDVTKIVTDLYSWPILSKDKTKKDVQFDWISVTHKLFKQGLRADYFFTVLLDIESDNNTKKILRLTQPNFSTHQAILLSDSDEYLKEYKETIIKSIRRVGAEGDVENDVIGVMEFERKLANISVIESYYTTTIRELESTYPKLKWLDYINGIFSPYGKFNGSEKIYVAVPFIENFYNLMTNPVPSNRTVANYALWRTVRNIEQMEPDESHYNETENERKLSCTAAIYTIYMYHAASALYVKNHSIDSAVEAAMNMTLVMRKKFIEIIRDNKWLTKQMKDKLEKKIMKMDLLVGYPIELRNDTVLDNFYHDLDISSDNFIINGLNYRKFELRKKGENLREAYNKTHWTGYFAHVLETNARHGVHNSIHVPVDLIESSLTDLNVPSYVNYAQMGFNIAREMAHVLTVGALNYDENGNQNKNWWDDENLKEYVKKMDCIIEKYNNYTHPAFKDLTVNGNRTIDENMSDISGLKVAYDAYLDHIKDKAQEAVLPGLENYSPLQLFWMLYGSAWCVDESYDELVQQFESSERAPERYRINGVVSSLKEFSEDFSCPSTAAMNPVDKCAMWF